MSAGNVLTFPQRPPALKPTSQAQQFHEDTLDVVVKFMGRGMAAGDVAVGLIELVSLLIVANIPPEQREGTVARVERILRGGVAAGGR